MIRLAAVADAAAIATLSGQLGYPSTEAEVRARLTDVREREDSVVFVTEDAGVVIAWIHVYGIHTLESDAHAEIAGLVVDEAHRNRGIGQALVAAAETWATKAGYRDIRVRSNVIRERTHRFYEREGYRIVKRQAAFVKSLA